MSLNYRQAGEVLADCVTQLLNPVKGVQLPRWPTFNQFLGGLRPNELTLLCAPTGAGKTQWLANVSAQLFAISESQFCAPVETGDTDYMTRVLSCLDGFDLNSGDGATFDRVKRITDTHLDALAQSKFFISTHDNRVDIEEMINLLKHMHEAYGVTVAILDNLNFFLKVVSSQMEKAEMDNSIHEFVILAKKIPMHIILVVHPRKTLDGRVESEFDIKGSSTAVQEAANVILFNRPKTQDIEKGTRQRTDRELVFRKIRKRGVNVGWPIWFAFENGRYMELK